MGGIKPYVLSYSGAGVGEKQCLLCCDIRQPVWRMTTPAWGSVCKLQKHEPAASTPTTSQLLLCSESYACLPQKHKTAVCNVHRRSCTEKCCEVPATSSKMEGQRPMVLTNATNLQEHSHRKKIGLLRWTSTRKLAYPRPTGALRLPRRATG